MSAIQEEQEEEDYMASMEALWNSALDNYEGLGGDEQREPGQVVDKAADIGGWDLLNLYNPIYEMATSYHPACALLRYLVNSRITCPLIKMLDSYFRKSTPGIDPILARHHAPSHPKYPNLPLPLLQPWDPLVVPDTIPQELACQEKATYYWYYSMILNLWRFVVLSFRAREASAPPPPFPQIAPPGWRSLDKLMGFEDYVLGNIITNDQGHLVVVYRGSVIGADWVSNFDYSLVKPPEYRMCVQGHVHEGYYNLVETHMDALYNAVQAVKPSRITVTGHSLGGAMATFAAYYLATSFPEIPTEAVVVGAPQVADEEFFADYRRKVNSRTIAFLGRGYEGRDKSSTGKRRLEIGDLVCQVPFACYYTPDCKSHNRFLYHLSPGLVAIYPTNLTNADAWVKESNWLLDRKIGGDGMSSNHMCSYMCWFSEGSVDHGSLCYFPENGPPAPPGVDVCDISRQKSEARRRREERRENMRNWDGHKSS